MQLPAHLCPGLLEVSGKWAYDSGRPMDRAGTDTITVAARLLPGTGVAPIGRRCLQQTLHGHAPIRGRIPDPDFPDSSAGLMGETH